VAVDADSVNAYTNPNGLGLTSNDQLAYNRWLAAAAHEAGLAIALKNDLYQAKELLGDFDFFINEWVPAWGGRRGAGGRRCGGLSSQRARAGAGRDCNRPRAALLLGVGCAVEDEIGGCQRRASGKRRRQPLKSNAFARWGPSPVDRQCHVYDECRLYDPVVAGEEAGAAQAGGTCARGSCASQCAALAGPASRHALLAAWQAAASPEAARLRRRAPPACRLPALLVSWLPTNASGTPRVTPSPQRASPFSTWSTTRRPSRRPARTKQTASPQYSRWAGPKAWGQPRQAARAPASSRCASRSRRSAGGWFAGG
jgi:hypothetical protein